MTLSGRGPLHSDLRRRDAIGDLLRDVREELGIASPFVWVDRIVDRTRAELDRTLLTQLDGVLDGRTDGLNAPTTIRDAASGLLLRA